MALILFTFSEAGSESHRRTNGVHSQLFAFVMVQDRHM